MEIFNKMNQIADDAFKREEAHQKIQKLEEEAKKAGIKIPPGQQLFYHSMDIDPAKLIPLRIVEINKQPFKDGLQRRMSTVISIMQSITQIMSEAGVFYNNPHEQVELIVHETIKAYRSAVERNKKNGPPANS